MAEVTVRLFGVLRADTRLAKEQVEAERLEDIFALLNEKVEERYRKRGKGQLSLEHPAPLTFQDAVIYINGNRCTKKKRILQDGDDIWLLSPASGG